VNSEINQDKGRELSKKLVLFIDEQVKADAAISPREVTMSLVLVLTGHVAMCRTKESDPISIASWLASYVANEYMGAHRFMSKQEAKMQPAG
jgi:hypothetical protein